MKGFYAILEVLPAVDIDINKIDAEWTKIPFKYKAAVVDLDRYYHIWNRCYKLQLSFC